MPGNAKESSIDEKDLLQRVRRLDEAALAVVFDSYYAPLYRYLYTHLGHGPTAEDLTAEVFRIFLEQVHAGQGPTQMLRAWLYRVAHNLMVDELRRRKHHEHDPLDEKLEDSLPGESAPGTLAQRREQRREVLEALNRLSAKQQAVLTLKYLQGLENDEIARTLHIAVGTVRALQFRGLRALHRHLRENGTLDGEMDEV